MKRENIIIITDGESYETWGSLTELCENHGLSYNYLKKKKFPFDYIGIHFEKVPFRAKNGIKIKSKTKNI